MPHIVGDITEKGIEALHASPTSSQHSVDGTNSLELAARRLPTVGSNTTIARATKTRPIYIIPPPLFLIALALALMVSLQL